MCTLFQKIISLIVRTRQHAKEVIFMSVIVEMAIYTNGEYADIVLAYSRANCVSRVARRMYAQLTQIDDYFITVHLPQPRDV